MATEALKIHHEVTGDAAKKDEMQVISVPRLHVPIYKEHFDGNKLMSLMDVVGLNKAEDQQHSSQGVRMGRQQRPYDFDAILNLKTSNPHHSTCINTKVASTVGQGFLTEADKKRRAALLNPSPTDAPTPTMPFSTEKSKVAITLDPICVGTFQQALMNAAEDFFQLANGYLEIVRGGADGKITGIHHLPARDVHVYVEDLQYNFHYEINSDQGAMNNRRFARFGDKAGFMSRMGRSLAPGISVPGPDGTDMRNPRGISEVIHFKNHNTLSRWYGFSDWLSAVPSIDLSQCMVQQKYDFYLNRGVPEFLLFILGEMLSKEDKTKIDTAMQANIGRGNSHKSLMLNLANENIKVQLEKLAGDGKNEDNFQSNDETLGLKVVTAHRVPPLLAGIQIPGKLGANNELPNALMAFQVLVVGPAQHTFQSTLGDTLGNSLDNGGLALTYEDFALKTILDSIDIGIMSTVGGMRQPITGSGRDPKEGLKD